MKSLFFTLFVSFALLSGSVSDETALVSISDRSVTDEIALVSISDRSVSDEAALVSIPDRSVIVQVSATHLDVGKRIADLIDGANQYVSNVLDAPIPEVTVYILSREDWGTVTNPQIIYGMPHYMQQSLIVAAEDNEFWRANLPRDENLTDAQRQQLQAVYGRDDGQLSARPFFDLLGIHEMGHAWTTAQHVRRQRFWLEEFTCNLLMHTYIAELRPDLLAAIEILPEVHANVPREGLEFTTIRQFEEGYWNIGRTAPENYGWYQFRFHHAAREVYDAGGAEVFPLLWAFLKSQTEILDDDALLAGLTEVHPSLGDMIVNW